MYSCKCQCGQTFIVCGSKLKDRRTCNACSWKRVSAATIGKRRPKSLRKYWPTKRILALVNKSYLFQGSPTAKKQAGLTLRQIAKKVGWSFNAIKDLTLTTFLSQSPHSKPSTPWTPEELQLLVDKRKAHLSPLHTMFRKRGFQRSKPQLRDKILELQHLEHQDSYSAKETAQLIGLNSKQVADLSKSNQLKATSSGTFGWWGKSVLVFQIYGTGLVLAP